MEHTLTLGRNGSSAGLHAPVRNRYFYGKLLDADHLELEQRYFLEMGRLINRLTLGTGVLCGLRVGERDGKVVVTPGVAVDGLGREIVVTERITVDPWELEREDQDDDGSIPSRLVLCLAYHECEAEPAPVLVADCEIREDCVPGVIRERYQLRAMDAGEWSDPGHLTERHCRAIFGSRTPDYQTGAWDRPSDAAVLHRIGALLDREVVVQPDRGGGGLRERLCELLRTSCSPGPDCVPIALVTRDEEGAITVDECAPRTTIYSNATLLELILCLAQRVEECCGRRVTTQAPVITEMYPAPAQKVKESEREAELPDGLFRLTFDHEMDAGRLNAPNDWMRVILFLPKLEIAREAETTGPSAAAVVLPVELTRSEAGDDGGTTAVYGLTAAGKPLLDRLKPTELLVAVVIRSDDVSQIADTADPPEILDADFAATGLSPMLVREWVWLVDPPQAVPLQSAALATPELPSTTPYPSLPSGNGIEGGLFHAWFAIDLES
jgi:hypothetical protein